MRRRIFTEDHETLRGVAEQFFDGEMDAHAASWRADGRVDRGLFARAGALGFFGFRVPEHLGGAGLSTYSYNVVVSEAAATAGFSNVGFRVHGDIVMPYFTEHGTLEQQERFLPDLVSGRRIAAIAMSEPGAGSDLAGISTKAARDGDEYVINGSKTFITNGLNADVVVVVARTGTGSARSDGLTLLIVDGASDGLSRGAPIEKMGLPYSDTCELFFQDVRVPVANRLGAEGAGFALLGANLPQERLSISVGAVAMSRVALHDAIEFARQRTMFGSRLSAFQNTKFVLAEMATEVQAAEQYLDNAVDALDEGALSPEDAARLKLFCTEVQGRVVDKALQIHGGYGYTSEYPISAMYTDARVTRIYGGSSEIMKVIVARSLGV